MNKNYLKIDTVGSFLPPEYLIEAREAHSPSTEELADRAVSEIVERQLQAGLSEVTSGELRRRKWDKDFWFGLSGIRRERVEGGHIYQEVDAFTDVMRFEGRIAFNPEHPFFHDFSYLHSCVAGRAVCRQTLPSPANLYSEILSMSEGHPETIYSGDLLADIAEAYNKTIMRLYELGCRSIQLDDSACGLLCDEEENRRLLQGGTDLNTLYDNIVKLFNDTLAGLPADMSTSLYLSAADSIVPHWEFEPMSDNVMARILAGVNAGKFYLPFEAANTKSFDILSNLPEGKEVVLGIVEAHSPFPDKTRKINEAVALAHKYLPLGAISISPKTGFKLSSHANRGLTFEDQWYKISELAEARQNLETIY